MSDAYDQGMKAAREGREVWENPHASPAGARDAFYRWFAGWCWAKQLEHQGE